MATRQIVECPHPGCEFAQYAKTGVDQATVLRPHFRLTHGIDLTPERWEEIQYARIAQALTPGMLRGRR